MYLDFLIAKSLADLNSLELFYCPIELVGFYYMFDSFNCQISD